MTGVNREFIEHNINIISGSTPIKQKKSGEAGDMNKGINTEMAKLVDEGILREAIFPTWIANLVIVKNTTDRDGCVLITLI